MDIDTPENLGGWSVQSILNRLRDCETELRRQREMINQTDRTVREIQLAPATALDESDMETWLVAVNAAASAFGVTPEAILGRSRRYQHTTPRHVARWLLSHVSRWVYPRIGHVARTDHRNVMHSVHLANNLRSDNRYKAQLEAAERYFRGGPNA